MTSPAPAADPLEAAVSGRRLSREEFLAIYDLPAEAVLAAAHEVRLQRTHPDVVTYAVGGNIDYTNVCTVACKFCAFYRTKNQADAYTYTLEQIAQEMAPLAAIGVSDVLIQGGVNPDLPFEWYLDVMRFMKAEHPTVHVDALSPEEMLGLEKITGRPAPELFEELAEAGMDGMTGATAEILADDVRHRIAPARINTADWFRIVEAAQRLGLLIPWVGMVFGFGETFADRVDHLIALRDHQEKMVSQHGNGYAAFKVWPARLSHTRLRDKVVIPSPEEIEQQYLLEVAIARLALDNFPHHRAVWRTMGFPVAGQALQCGADDLCCTGTINAIEATITAAGKENFAATRALVSRVEQCITDAGFAPALRDPRYNVLAVNPGRN